jgi:16S rRNA (adenine1518-N6/adenine1519-N6)-dimethyltransferase
MKKNDLLDIFREMDFHPGKQLGQNFLIDENLLRFIVREAAPSPGETILEVGPGFGVLTRALLETGVKVIAVEFDRRISEYLRNNIKHSDFTLVEGDACRVNLEDILQGVENYRCVANLPYSASSVFIARMLELTNPPQSMLFMLQKEMAQRLAAKPGIKNYGSLSVRVQAVFKTKLLRTVPPQVFFPQPDVESAIANFELKDEIPPVGTIRLLSKLTKTAFAKRRKKMFKPLCKDFSADCLEKAYDSMGISKDARPEELSVEQFIEMAKIIGEE